MERWEERARKGERGGKGRGKEESGGKRRGREVLSVPQLQTCHYATGNRVSEVFVLKQSYRGMSGANVPRVQCNAIQNN